MTSSESRDAWMLRAKAAEDENAWLRAQIRQMNVTLEYYDQSSRMWMATALKLESTLKDVREIFLKNNQSVSRFLRLAVNAWKAERARALRAEKFLRDTLEWFEDTGRGDTAMPSAIRRYLEERS